QRADRLVETIEVHDAAGPHRDVGGRDDLIAGPDLADHVRVVAAGAIPDEQVAADGEERRRLVQLQGAGVDLREPRGVVADGAGEDPLAGALLDEAAGARDLAGKG